MRLYTPAIKAKANDISSLASLSTEALSRITPLLEVPISVERQLVETKVEKSVKEVAEKLPDIPFYFDPLGIESPMRQIAAFHALATLGRKVIPTISLDRPLDLPALRNVLNTHSLKLCIRLDATDVEAYEETWDRLGHLSRQLNDESRKLDVIVDLKRLKPSKNVSHIRDIVVDFFAARPRAVPISESIVLASSALDSVAEVDIDKTKAIRREELGLWAVICFELAHLDMKFGDYGVVSPNFVFSGPNPNANAKIRYTAGESIHYFRGHGLYRPSRFDQYHELAKRVTDSGLYLGSNFSAGDEHIRRCADRQCGPGNLATWVRVDTNHHAELTTRQITALHAGLHGISNESEIRDLLVTV